MTEFTCVWTTCTQFAIHGREFNFNLSIC